MGVVHAIRLNSSTRSHFDAQEYIELGTQLEAVPPADHATCSKAGRPQSCPVLATNGSPTSLLNFVPTVNLNDPSDFSQWGNDLVGSQQAALRQMYKGDSILHRTGLRTLEALNIVSPLVEKDYQPADDLYNDDELGQQLKTIAQMIKLEPA